MTFAYGAFNNMSSGIFGESMEYIKNELLREHGPPSRITTNHDYRLREKIQEAWPDANVEAHFKDFCTSILHRAFNSGNILFDNDAHRILLSKLFTLAWLPANLIADTFAWLEASIPADLREVFHGLMQWFKNTYIKGLQPGVISCYRKEHLLNSLPWTIPRNLLNKINSHRAVRFSGYCPLWILYGKSLDVIASSRKDCGTLLGNDVRAKQNISMSPKISTTMVSLGDIHRLWNKLDERSITSTRFLSIACNLVREYYDTLVFQRDFERFPLVPSNLEHDHIVVNIENIQQGNPLQAIEQLNFEAYEVAIRREQADLQVTEQQQQAQQEAQQEVEQEVQQPLLINQAAANNENDDGILRCYQWKCYQCDDQHIEMICRPCNCICLCRACSDLNRDLTQNVAEVHMQCPLCMQRATNYDALFMDLTNNPDFPIDWKCQICSDRPKTHVMQVCKHLICLVCMETIRANDVRDVFVCPFCRRESGAVEAHFIMV
ncbi:uncharacterized protein LOC122849283 [Aphidius gifuensis]|uniref:uncharacterized protein LOC122849283 n=1 Tax=Aphidius gifuensis TaxID=684658 RepID=UPI001CDCCCED|nr:uncharacterized protein LOC122849283 [Aphidius gifuensis]XP_044003892.1 uncharacterized protein LOC122849283 [Aphidius gifuensis]